MSAARSAPPLSSLACVAQWSVLVTPAGPGALNMALDHALLRRAGRTGSAVLRVYAWDEPTLSFGRHQPARGSYDRRAIGAAGLSVVRRPTGGRAVLHDHEITYSVTAPLPSESGGPSTGMRERRACARRWYAAINQLLVAGLRQMGVADADAAAAVDGRAPPPPTPAACFDLATEGEIVARGRKLVGSAQWREFGAVLQHGSILLADDQCRLTALQPADAPPPVPTATLRELLGRAPTLAEVAAALRRALDEALDEAGGRPAEPYRPDDLTERDAAALRLNYESEAWTWRR